MKHWTISILTIMFCCSGILPAQAQYGRHPEFPFAPNIIIPQIRPPFPPMQRPVEIRMVSATITITGQSAETMLEISLFNPGSVRQESELIMPVPSGAAVKTFSIAGALSEPTARLLSREEARRIYEEIVSKMRDPGLLEFAGYNLIRSSVFPVEPFREQKIMLAYEHLLPISGNRIDYILPRSESIEYAVPWEISVNLKAGQPVSTLYSPSHPIHAKRISDSDFILKMNSLECKNPGPFLLSYLLESKNIASSFFAYPDPKIGGGYFLMLAGLPSHPLKEPGTQQLKREVTLVFDRSGSMNGEKMEQVRQAAFQILEGLEPDEYFNIITYNEAVVKFSEAAVIRSSENIKSARSFIEETQPRGGTNIYDALLEAIRQKPVAGSLPIVLFLTDGLPTIGQTSEASIRDMVVKGNTSNRRIFTFGVGVDVNCPLLEKIALETRATATFVLPKEDVEVKVSEVFARLQGPVLSDPEMKIDGISSMIRSRIDELIPAKLPDLFENDQLVLLGRYKGEDSVAFQLTGNYLGRSNQFEFTFEPSKATTQNAFVPRLWASRKIAILIDAIREMGADIHDLPGAVPSPNDRRLKELQDEIIRLSKEFGILTEYTAFLATEGVDLTDHRRLMDTAGDNFRRRAMETRSGKGAVSQSDNLSAQRAQTVLNPKNEYYDENMTRVSVSSVQQVNDRAFYQQNGTWVDSRLLDSAAATPSRTVRFGSEDYFKLADRLAKENRQGAMAMNGNLLIQIETETILVIGPENN